MTSILTNISAMSALQTLRAVSGALENAQNEVSSGLRVAIASDNAAYWSISTTMRSDNQAISAVTDALGLGAAKVDTAYAGMEAVVDVLSDFRAKLVTAREESADKAKIQGELKQLGDQARSIATSASFSGQNWLTTDIADIFDDTLNRTSVVSSFVRERSGVSVRTMGVDLSAISLINSTGGGLLQADPRDIGTIGGLRYSMSSGIADDMSSQSLNNTRGSHPADFSFDFSSPLVFADGDSISFKITLDADNPADGIPLPHDDGKTTDILINKSVVNAALRKTDGTISNYKEYAIVLRAALAGSGATATTYWKYDPPGQTRTRVDIPDVVGIRHQGLSDYNGSSMQITDLDVVGVAVTGEIADTSINYGVRRSSMTLDFSPFTVYDGITVQMNFMVGNGQSMPLSFDQEYVNALLGVDDGTVETAADMAILLNALIDRDDIIIEDAGGGTVSVYTDPLIDRKSGEKSSIGFYGINVSNEPRPTMDFFDIDIEQNPDMVEFYLGYVETMMSNVISGAAVLGSLKQRIDMQSDFASKLMDSIDSGIGRLVDADMEEASVRLKALQTQQQLAVQSLQIANSRPEDILRLFN